LSDSDEGILNVHQQLQNARGNAAQLQANDQQLNELNRLIYGGGESPAVEDIIEGEIVEEVRAAKVD
jgi:glutamine amidotransferase PdxT